MDNYILICDFYVYKPLILLKFYIKYISYDLSTIFIIINIIIIKTQNMLTCKQSYQQIVDNFTSIFHLNNFNIYIIMVNKELCGKV